MIQAQGYLIMKCTIANLFILHVLCTGCFSKVGTETESKADSDTTATHAIPEADTLWRNGNIVSIRRRTIPKTAPEYPAGSDSLYSYIAENLVYPVEAIESGIEGNVMVVLTVDKNGSLSIFDIFDIGYGTKEAAAKVILSTAPWKPAINLETQQPISATLLVPISFQLEKD